MKTYERVMVVMAAMVIIIGFTANSFAGLLGSQKLYEPPVPIGGSGQKLLAVQGNKVHQAAKSSNGTYDLYSINLMDPARPYVMGKVCLQMTAVYEVLQGRNWVYVLGDFNRGRYVHVIDVSDPQPRIDSAFPVPSDAFAMSLSRKCLAVIGKDTLKVFDIDKPRKVSVVDEYVERAGGFAAIKINGRNAYVLCHPPGQPSRIINYSVTDSSRVEKINSVPVSPFAAELYLLDEFNDGYVMAMGTEEPKISETYPFSRPKLEVRAYFDAFAITRDHGKLKPIQAPITSSKEMVVAVTSCDNVGQMFHIAEQEWFWNERQGQFVSRPVIKQFGMTRNGFSLLQATATGITYPTFMEQFGDSLCVYGFDFDGKPQLEIFQVTK
ncbi:hypothetical protein HGA34_05445 [Candidatus Falkowbacteria bacterium]|nr:hypothetical protein [Candidatus Falkowbacteria bacterium]